MDEQATEDSPATGLPPGMGFSQYLKEAAKKRKKKWDGNQKRLGYGEKQSTAEP